MVVDRHGNQVELLPVVALETGNSEVTVAFLLVEERGDHLEVGKGGRWEALEACRWVLVGKVEAEDHDRRVVESVHWEGYQMEGVGNHRLQGVQVGEGKVVDLDFVQASGSKKPDLPQHMMR